MSFVNTLGAVAVGLTLTVSATNCAPGKKHDACLEERLDAAAMMLSAQQAIEQGDAGRARQILDSIRKEWQDTKEYHFLRGQAYAALAERVEMPAAFDSAMLQEDLIKMREQACQRKYALFDEAIKSYKRAILIKEDVTSIQGLAITYWRRGRSMGIPADVAAAADGFQRILELMPEMPDVHAVLGGAYVWMAMTSADVQKQEQLYVRAYAQFVSAREKNKTHPLCDKRMLDYVNESINELENRIPEERRFH